MKKFFIWLILIIIFLNFEKKIIADHNCYESCGTPSFCNNGLSCMGGICKNANCPDQTDCVCDYPNCKNLTVNQTTLGLGKSYNFSATYENYFGPVDNRGFSVATSCSSPFINDQTSIGGPGTVSWTWIPNLTGTYTVFCRAWNDSIAECRGDCVDGPPRYSCRGPNAKLTVTVVAPPTPSGSCGSFNYNSDNPATPITFTWTNPIPDPVGLQVWDNTGKWWYNNWANSPITINIPPGRIVYARTTYSFTHFSPETNITCSLPPNPSPAIISGSLQQKSGDGCYVANDTNNFSLSNPTITSNPSNCVSTNCIVLPTNNNAKTYTCTTTFNSNDCLNYNPATWPTSAILTLTSIAPVGYTLYGWTTPGSCSLPTNTKTVNAGTYIDQSITFDFIGNKWFKIKNASFNRSSTNNITIPLLIEPYDTFDDDGQKYFMIGQTGAALGIVVSDNRYSINNWHKSDYNRQIPLSIDDFLNYIKARKSYQAINNLNELTQDKIYLYQGNLDINDSSISIFNNRKLVLIVTGSINFNVSNEFQPSNASIAFLAKKINFSNTVSIAKGIFVAESTDTGSANNQGLKIIGNLISLFDFTSQRKWSNTAKPSIFVVFKPEMYLDLLPYLSISKYDWKQLQ